jgi:transforming growth factor-beta-induced protein
VITSDIEASNGVIHIIDSVLLPPDEKLTPREAAKDVIELAIRRGVPLFNAGQPSACAAIYEVAVESLLKFHSNALDSDDRSILERTLRKVRSDDEDPHQQSWRLRRTLDAVYESLGRN